MGGSGGDAPTCCLRSAQWLGMAVGTATLAQPADRPSPLVRHSCNSQRTPTNATRACWSSHGDAQPLLERLFQLGQKRAQQRQRQGGAVPWQGRRTPGCLRAQGLRHLQVVR